jgi:hypothetical protein
MPAKKTKSPTMRKLTSLDSKAKFFLFISAFLIIGAGYFAYKSFASTDTYTVSGDQLEIKAGAGLGKDKDPNNSKRRTTVAVLPSAASNPNASVALKSTPELTNFIKKHNGRNVRMCAVVKTPNAEKAQALLSGINQTVTDQAVPVPEEGAYTEVCSRYTKLTTRTSFAIPNVRHTGDKDQFFIHSISLQIQ